MVHVVGDGSRVKGAGRMPLNEVASSVPSNGSTAVRHGADVTPRWRAVGPGAGGVDDGAGADFVLRAGQMIFDGAHPGAAADDEQIVGFTHQAGNPCAALFGGSIHGMDQQS